MQDLVDGHQRKLMDKSLDAQKFANVSPWWIEVSQLKGFQSVYLKKTTQVSIKPLWSIWFRARLYKYKPIYHLFYLLD